MKRVLLFIALKIAEISCVVKQSVIAEAYKKVFLITNRLETESDEDRMGFIGLAHILEDYIHIIEAIPNENFT